MRQDVLRGAGTNALLQPCLPGGGSQAAGRTSMLVRISISTVDVNARRGPCWQAGTTMHAQDSIQCSTWGLNARHVTAALCP